MEMEWNPSPTVVAKAKKITELHDKQKKTHKEIAMQLGHKRNYIVSLNTWYRKHIQKEGE